jgi:branched-chain amino acid aminotransferase
MTTTTIEVKTTRQTGRTELPDPANIEFGQLFTPHWFLTEFEGGQWRNPRVEPLRGIELHPAANVLQYAQGIIEGMKGYRRQDGRIALFRPLENAKRFAGSAERMGMPPVELDLFVDAVRTLVATERNYIPREPGTLYLRPTMIASEACIGVRSANEFLFYVIALPAGAYFKGVERPPGCVSVYVAETTSRAAPGGTGCVKATANYAISLKTITDARHAGCAQVLFLSACGTRQVEEMGGMNVFFIENETLLTPPLGDTILPGITRDSVITLARSLGHQVREQPLNVDELAGGIESGRVTEGFACGTAATIVGISNLAFETGRRITIGNGTTGRVTSKLYQALQDIQFGRAEDKWGWTEIVDI